MKLYTLKNKKGMSIVELLVALSILVIVTVGLNAFFVYMWRSRFDEMNRGQSTLSASRSISIMSENIRKASQANSGAYAVHSANDFDIIFYSDIDSDQNRERVHYYVNGTSIMAGTTEPILGDSPTYPSEDENIFIIASDVINDPSEPIFIYYNSTGDVLGTPANVSSIRRVGLNVLVNTNPSRISDTVIQTSVSLRNLNK